MYKFISYIWEYFVILRLTCHVILIVHFSLLWRSLHCVSMHNICIIPPCFLVEYVIHMLTYVEGVPLRERRSKDPQTWFCVGQLLGHVREALKVSCQWISAQNNDFNPLRAKFSRGNINIYLHYLSFLHIDLTQELKNPSSSKTRTYIFYIVNIMAADVLAT